eukprot:gene15045-biopygen20160
MCARGSRGKKEIRRRRRRKNEQNPGARSAPGEKMDPPGDVGFAGAVQSLFEAEWTRSSTSLAILLIRSFQKMCWNSPGTPPTATDQRQRNRAPGNPGDSGRLGEKRLGTRPGRARVTKSYRAGRVRGRFSRGRPRGRPRAVAAAPKAPQTLTAGPCCSVGGPAAAAQVSHAPCPAIHRWRGGSVERERATSCRSHLGPGGGAE